MGMGQEGGGEGAEGILGEETDGRGGRGPGRLTGAAWGCRGAQSSPSDQEGGSRQRAGHWGRSELGAGGGPCRTGTRRLAGPHPPGRWFSDSGSRSPGLQGPECDLFTIFHHYLSCYGKPLPTHFPLVLCCFPGVKFPGQHQEPWREFLNIPSCTGWKSVPPSWEVAKQRSAGLSVPGATWRPVARERCVLPACPSEPQGPTPPPPHIHRQPPNEAPSPGPFSTCTWAVPGGPLSALAPLMLY